MVKQLYIWIFLLGFSVHITAQVGINTINPKAQLDISILDMDNPQNTDGILIPRINKFPVTNPTASQHGMLVFLNKDEVGSPAGFYFWDQVETKWQPIAHNAFSNFYKEGTTQPSNDIDDAIFRNGNIRIGGVENDEVKLGITIGSSAPEQKIKTGLEILNENSATSRNTYSITTNNKSTTNAIKYGIKNTVSAAGEGVHYGIWNSVSQNPDIINDVFGIYNHVGKTFGAHKKHYGIYSEIGTEQAEGWIYGIYSEAIGVDAEKIYAGFFNGRVGIGNPSTDEEYVLPATRGKENQVLMTDNKGIVSWKFPHHKNYTSTSSAPSNYIIPDEVFTLRIYPHINDIRIPDSSENLGRILILINWFGNSQTTFSFLSGDTIYDPTTDSEINVIDGGERLKIQSIGYNKWIVIGN